MWCTKLKFEIWWRFDQWLLRFLTFNILRSSSLGGHLPFFEGSLRYSILIILMLSSYQAFLILVWCHELTLKSWGRSHQWLLRYSILNILRSSCIRGHLPSKVVFIETFFDFGLAPWAYVQNLRKIGSVAAEI